MNKKKVDSILKGITAAGICLLYTSELYNAVNQALINNMIILAFDNTAHSKELYPMGNIFDSSNYVKDVYKRQGRDPAL